MFNSRSRWHNHIIWSYELKCNGEGVVAWEDEGRDGQTLLYLHRNLIADYKWWHLTLKKVCVLLDTQEFFYIVLQTFYTCVCLPFLPTQFSIGAGAGNTYKRRVSFSCLRWQDLFALISQASSCHFACLTVRAMCVHVNQISKFRLQILCEFSQRHLVTVVLSIKFWICTNMMNAAEWILKM